jgi:hypothetical protein
MFAPITLFRLACGPDESGLHCGEDGLSLSGTPLLRKGPAGFEPRPITELQAISYAAYGRDRGLTISARISGLRSVARALNDGDLARAMTTSLFLQLPEVDEVGIARLFETRDLLKIHAEVAPQDGQPHVTEDEPRDWHGRWTTGSGTTANVVPVQLTFPVPLPPLIGGVGGSPNSKDDDFVYPPSAPSPTNSPANDNAGVNAITTTDDDTPKVCPDPSFEANSVGRTREQLLYQAQINGLPLGYHVMLNNIGYDGCYNLINTSVMLEAKYNISDWFAIMPDFVKRKVQEYGNIISQAIIQNYSSGGRKVEWHFSNPRVAAFWASEFAEKNLDNIEVFYTPFDPDFSPNVGKFFFLAAA